MTGRESGDPYYDLFDDWDLIVASFLSQYGLRIRTKEFESVSWDEFRSLISGLSPDTVLGLSLIHICGAIAATESIVYYLKKIFGNDIRVFVPQIAMSAGTMIALSSKAIILGKQSNLGPIDPQFGGMSCAAIIEEFEEALSEVKINPSSAQIWGLIIKKYHPTFIGDCRKRCV